MPLRSNRDATLVADLTRRHWLAVAVAWGGSLAFPAANLGADEAADVLAQLQEQARKAGLGPFRTSTSAHYLGIGDAPDDHRAEALRRCEALATAYFTYFQEKGFSLAFPRDRLTVVILKHQGSYAAWLGEKPDELVGGHYDLGTNRLVTFDFRPSGELPSGVNLKRLNMFTLVHEATHQLTFNTGLLDRRGDVPDALSEGLATYAELWNLDNKSAIGMLNRPRLQVLVDQAEQPEVWIPLEKFLTDDEVFRDPATAQLAYAEAWVLVHYMLRTTAALPKFRAYLDAIRPRRDRKERLADARATLGDLGRLNVALRKHALQQIQDATHRRSR